MSGLFDFSFGEKKPDDSVAPVVEPSPQSPASGAVNLARERVSESIPSSAKRKGRPPKSEIPSGADTEALRREIALKQLEGVYEPEAWAALLSLPGDAALTFTGREYWKIGKEERTTLGATGSAAARAMMISDPRALAFLMLASALFSVYVPRAVQEMKHQRAEKAKENEPKKNT